MAMESARLRSAHLGNERTLWIQKPRGIARPCPLVVFLDGELYLKRVHAGAIVRKLTRRGKIAEAWHVFVSMHSFEARWRECPCHPPFARFIAEELMPWLEGRHPEIKQAPRRVLIGLSYTGLAAAFVALRYPDLFQRVVCQSGSFWWRDCWLVRSYRRTRRRIAAEFFLDVGREETERNVRFRPGVFQGISQIEGVRAFRDVLERRGNAVTYAEFEGGHEPKGWAGTLPAALQWALEPAPSG